MNKFPTINIELTLYMKNLLLGEICKRLDIIKYCNYFLKLELKQTKGDTYKGNCPWCGKKEVLFCNKTNGTSRCESCGIEADFFDIITKHWDFDLGFTLKLISWQLVKAGEYVQSGTGSASLPGGEA